MKNMIVPACCYIYFKFKFFIFSFLVDKTVEVFFVDFGWIQKVRIDNLRELPKEEFEKPMQAFHCFLSNVSIL